MEYAAVIIPTLNRKKHLQRCVDSLKKNKLAKQTDLYISVDYPPSVKYESGYSDVIEYVNTIDGFSTIHIFLQNANLGPGLNRKFLEDSISQHHDKYIFTDDDNEFSTNFLDYMNWGLEKYKDDESVYAICSCTDFPLMDETKADFFKVQSYNPYGSGHWLHKNKKCADFLNQASLDNFYKSHVLRKRLYNASPMVFSCVAQDSLRMLSVMRGRNGNITYVDIWENFYIVINNLYCVKPIAPKSRNWGLDGSGVHIGQQDVENYIPSVALDESSNWPVTPIEETDDLVRKYNDYHKEKFRIGKKEYIKSILIFLTNSIIGNEFTLKLYRFFFAKKNIVKEDVFYG